jgi:hypothetical protein
MTMVSDPFTVIFACENAEPENSVTTISVAAILLIIFIFVIISIIKPFLQIKI